MRRSKTMLMDIAVVLVVLAVLYGPLIYVMERHFEERRQACVEAGGVPTRLGERCFAPGALKTLPMGKAKSNG